MPNLEAALRDFNLAISSAPNAETAFKALHALANALVGARLFSVMTVDTDAGVARRAYSSDLVNYPVSGTKPIQHNYWFDVVHLERRPFVANTIEEIADVFPDYQLIDSLGCQSVVNLPVVLGDKLVATVNLLDREGHFTSERMSMIEVHLTTPAKLICLLADTLST
jgi:GAF domain-containing protein